MKTISFPEITARVAAHWQAETERNAPKPAAIRTVYLLASLFAELGPDDRARVLDVLREEVLGQPVPA